MITATVSKSFDLHPQYAVVIYDKNGDYLYSFAHSGANSEIEIIKLLKALKVKRVEQINLSNAFLLSMQDNGIIIKY